MTLPTAPGVDDDQAAEIFDPRIPRVDAVAGPAHGIPFHIIKAESGRLTKEQQSMADDLADTVGDAHKRADTDPSAAGDTVDPEKDPATTTPGSPAWEAIDAAKARETLVGITAVRQLVGELQAREQTEARNDGDADDADNACDLGDALEALEFVLGILAKFAVTEQAEADQGLAEIEAEAEALGLKKALDRSPVLKAGRVLSSQNQAAIEQADQLLQGVLGQLAKAPQAAEGGEPIKVTKAGDLSAMPGPLLQLLEQFLAAAGAWQSTQGDDTTDPTTDTGMEAAPVADPTTDPAAAPVAPLTAVADSAAPVADPAAPAAPETPAAAAPVAAPAAAPDTAPAPAPVVEGDPEAVQKALAAQSDSLLESLTKSLTGAVEAAVKPLEERIAKMESTPVSGGPMLAGQLPGVIAQMRGQNEAPQTSDDPVARIAKALDEITDPQAQAEARSQALEQVLKAKLFPTR